MADVTSHGEQRPTPTATDGQDPATMTIQDADTKEYAGGHPVNEDSSDSYFYSDSDSDSDSYVSGDQSSTQSDHCSEPKGIRTIQLKSDRVPTGLDPNVRRRNDTIAWSAHVYDARNERKLRRRDRSPLDVDVRYVDHKPLTFTKRPRKKKASHKDHKNEGYRGSSTSAIEGPTSKQETTWRGPVIEVLVHIRARISDRFYPPHSYDDEGADIDELLKQDERISRRRRSISRSSSPPKSRWQLNPDILPKKIEDLSIDQRSRRSLVIRSKHLDRALYECFGWDPDVFGAESTLHYPPSWNRLTIFEEPYKSLMQNFSVLKRVESGEMKPPHKARSDVERDGSDDLTSIQREHLSILVKFLQPLYEKLIVPCLSRLSESTPRIEFGLLWYLFKPHTDVYVRDDHGAIQVCVIAQCRTSTTSVHPIRRPRRDPRWWELEMWYLGTDGARIAPVVVTRQIFSYEDYKDIIALDIVPCEIWDITDKGKRRAEIMKRSKLMEKTLRNGFQLANYVPPLESNNYKFSGKVVIDHRRGRVATNTPPVDFNSRVTGLSFINYGDIYVNEYQKSDDEIEVLNKAVNKRERDLEEYYYKPRATRYEPDDFGVRTLPPPPPPPALPYASASHDQTITESLSDHQLLLLQPRLLAFSLKIKQWMWVDIGHLEEAEPSTESIKNLVIDAEELKTIRALSNQQSGKEALWAADFIEGKGSGRIILLHGPPGVGKTYTVESIAEWLDCPLLALTVADIGTAETRIESELLKWFSLAEAWNAVLLVDEADIFLERRQNRDLARNGLVSAFLRRMEYFKGLLFLTTNRVGQIDDAFISRVHVAIEYRPLSGKETKQIWEGFFRKLAKDRAGKIQVAPDAKRWVLDSFSNEKFQLNGRDIRNALQTAITLAEFESSEDEDFDPSTMTIIVTQKHFERVLNMSNRFQAYVSSIRKEDEKKRANLRGDRNDYDDVPLAALALR